MDFEERIRIRLRRPRNELLGYNVGRGVRGRQRARRAPHGSCIVVLLLRHTVDEPPLIANIGGHSRGKMLAETHLRPMLLA